MSAAVPSGISGDVLVRVVAIAGCRASSFGVTFAIVAATSHEAATHGLRPPMGDRQKALRWPKRTLLGNGGRVFWRNTDRSSAVELYEYSSAWYRVHQEPPCPRSTRQPFGLNDMGWRSMCSWSFGPGFFLSRLPR